MVVFAARQTSWTEEVAINLMMWVSLLGAACLLTGAARIWASIILLANCILMPGKSLMLSSTSSSDFAAVILIGAAMPVSEAFDKQILPALQIKLRLYVSGWSPITVFFILLFCIENIIEIFSGKEFVPEILKWRCKAWKQTGIDHGFQLCVILLLINADRGVSGSPPDISVAG